MAPKRMEKEQPPGHEPAFEALKGRRISKGAGLKYVVPAHAQLLEPLKMAPSRRVNYSGPESEIKEIKTINYMGDISFVVINLDLPSQQMIDSGKLQKKFGATQISSLVIAGPEIAYVDFMDGNSFAALVVENSKIRTRGELSEAKTIPGTFTLLPNGYAVKLTEANEIIAYAYADGAFSSSIGVLELDFKNNPPRIEKLDDPAFGPILKVSAGAGSYYLQITSKAEITPIVPSSPATSSR